MPLPTITPNDFTSWLRDYHASNPPRNNFIIQLEDYLTQIPDKHAALSTQQLVDIMAMHCATIPDRPIVHVTWPLLTKLQSPIPANVAREANSDIYCMLKSLHSSNVLTVETFTDCFKNLHSYSEFETKLAEEIQIQTPADISYFSYVSAKAFIMQHFAQRHILTAERFMWRANFILLAILLKKLNDSLSLQWQEYIRDLELFVTFCDCPKPYVAYSLIRLLFRLRSHLNDLMASNSVPPKYSARVKDHTETPERYYRLIPQLVRHPQLDLLLEVIYNIAHHLSLSMDGNPFILLCKDLERIRDHTDLAALHTLLEDYIINLGDKDPTDQVGLSSTQLLYHSNPRALTEAIQWLEQHHLRTSENLKVILLHPDSANSGQLIAAIKYRILAESYAIFGSTEAIAEIKEDDAKHTAVRLQDPAPYPMALNSFLLVPSPLSRILISQECIEDPAEFMVENSALLNSLAATTDALSKFIYAALLWQLSFYPSENYSMLIQNIYRITLTLAEVWKTTGQKLNQLPLVISKPPNSESLDEDEKQLVVTAQPGNSQAREIHETTREILLSMAMSLQEVIENPEKTRIPVEWVNTLLAAFYFPVAYLLNGDFTRLRPHTWQNSRQNFAGFSALSLIEGKMLYSIFTTPPNKELKIESTEEEQKDSQANAAQQTNLDCFIRIEHSFTMRL